MGNCSAAGSCATRRRPAPMCSMAPNRFWAHRSLRSPRWLAHTPAGRKRCRSQSHARRSGRARARPSARPPASATAASALSARLPMLAWLVRIATRHRQRPVYRSACMHAPSCKRRHPGANGWWARPARILAPNRNPASAHSAARRHCTHPATNEKDMHVMVLRSPHVCYVRAHTHARTQPAITAQPSVMRPAASIWQSCVAMPPPAITGRRLRPAQHTRTAITGPLQPSLMRQHAGQQCADPCRCRTPHRLRRSRAWVSCTHQRRRKKRSAYNTQPAQARAKNTPCSGAPKSPPPKRAQL